jgi:hypothetical protein
MTQKKKKKKKTPYSAQRPRAESNKPPLPQGSRKIRALKFWGDLP